MKLLKLAAFGAIGYLVYQKFFAESSGGSRRGPGHDGRRQGGASRSQTPQQDKMEETEDTSGTSVKHRVGRGVI